MDHELRTPPPQPGTLAAEVAHCLMRAFAAVDHWRRQVASDRPGLSATELAEAVQQLLAARLHDYALVFDDGVHNDLLVLLPEAIDNLGVGLTFDPAQVPAFGGQE